MSHKMTAKDAAEFLGVTVQAVHLSLRTNNIEFEKSKNRVFFGHNSARQLFNLPFRPTVFSFQIIKGGTGKSSLAYNCAIRANLYGARVLCIDLDHQGNLTDFLGVNPDNLPVMIDYIMEDADFKDCIVNVGPGLDLLPSRLDNSILDNQLMMNKANLTKVYKKPIESVLHNYDVVIIDNPPSLGHSVVASALASDYVVAPVNPDPSAKKGLVLTTQEMRKMAKANDIQLKVRVILNKHDKRTALSHQTLEQLMTHEEFSKAMYKTYIATSQEYTNAASSGHSVFDTIRDTTAKTDIDLLVREMLGLDELRENRNSAKRKSKLENDSARLKSSTQVPAA